MATVEEEACANVWIVNKLKETIIGWRVHISTDHNPLAYLAESVISGVQRVVWTVRRPRASSLGGIQGASFRKKNVGKWPKKKRKMSLPGHDAALGGASKERIFVKFDC